MGVSGNAEGAAAGVAVEFCVDGAVVARHCAVAELLQLFAELVEPSPDWVVVPLEQVWGLRSPHLGWLMEKD